MMTFPSRGLTRRGMLLGLLAAAPNPGTVAAQAHYADLARQLAPDTDVLAVSIGPNQDPHGFEPGPSVARAVAGARVVILNGLDYDPWMQRLLDGSRAPGRVVVTVAQVLGRHPGDNPHLWYDPAGCAAVTAAIAQALGAGVRLPGVLASFAPVTDRVAALRARFAGTPVTATEPVFGLMAAAIGVEMHNERFQLAMMNETEPRASDVAAFETDLRQRRVRALIYNAQTTGGSAQRLLGLAQRSGVPVVPVTETMPAGMHYQDWLLGSLDRLERALA